LHGDGFCLWWILRDRSNSYRRIVCAT
jgi:hypothetical protein